MGEKKFFKPIHGSDDARLRWKIKTERGRIAEFVIQLEIRLSDQWLPVVRYDNAHGFMHRDLLDLSGRLRAKTRIPFGTEKEAVGYAEADLVRRSSSYIERFFRRMRSP